MMEVNVESEIFAAMDQWIATVTGGMPDAPDQALALYAPEAVLLATFSPHILTTPKQIRDYFVRFTALPNLKARVTNNHVRIYGDAAINSGNYTFTYQQQNKTLTIAARYSFTYIKKPEGWMIVNHHSSVIPEPIW